jgi:hypothetical protein
MPPFLCHSCGAAITIGEPIPRDAECDSCRRDVRCCMNCRHYDIRYNNSCRETMADPVEDKDRRNFCEYFAPNQAGAPAAKSSAKQAESRAKLDALFGGAGPTGPSQTAREKLDAMFGAKPPADRAEDARKKLDALFKKEAPPDSES